MLVFEHRKLATRMAWDFRAQTMAAKLAKGHEPFQVPLKALRFGFKDSHETNMGLMSKCGAEFDRSAFGQKEKTRRPTYLSPQVTIRLAMITTTMIDSNDTNL